MYVGLENEDRLAVLNTLDNTLLTTIPAGQAAQAVVYVPNAVREGDGLDGLQALSTVGKVTQLSMAASTAVPPGSPQTSVALFEQGFIQMLQAAVNGLEPKQRYVLALATKADGSGTLESLAEFTTNAAGAAIVNALGPIRQVVQAEAAAPRRYLAIAPVSGSRTLAPVQLQLP
jgi:hypothetical protein